MKVFVLTTQKDEITLDDVISNNATTHLTVDAIKNHYDLLSTLQKSIGGSDVDAALYWLVRLAENQDVTEKTRHLLVIAFDDDAKSWETYTYLPEEIKDSKFFNFPKEHRSGKFEDQMQQRYEQLKQLQKKNRK